MIYDKIETKSITLGKSKKFDDEDKWITPVFYNGDSFEFTLKNKYVKIDKIEENTYGKQFITIKSKEYSDIIEQIADKLETSSPISPDGSFRASINNKTKINKEKNIKNNGFTACISLNFPTIYKDNEKKTLQIYVKNLVIIEVVEDELEIDFDKLKLAM